MLNSNKRKIGLLEQIEEDLFGQEELHSKCNFLIEQQLKELKQLSKQGRESERLQNNVLGQLEKLTVQIGNLAKSVKPRNTAIITTSGKAVLLNGLETFYFEADYVHNENSEKNPEIVFLLKKDRGYIVDRFALDIVNARNIIEKGVNPAKGEKAKFSKLDLSAWDYGLALMERSSEGLFSEISRSATTVLASSLERYSLIQANTIYNICVKSIFEAVKPILFKKKQQEKTKETKNDKRIF